MTREEDEFWRELQRQLDEERNDLAEIERQLDSVEESPLDDDAIDRMVSHAVGEDTGRILRTNRFGRFGAPLAAAAALLLTPKVLLAATAITAITAVSIVLWPSGQDSTRTLPYQNAVKIMMDDSSPLNARVSSCGTVAGDLMFTSLDLHRIRASADDPLAEDAGRALQTLKGRFISRQKLQAIQSFPDPYTALRSVVTDRQLDVDRRRDALRRLVPQMLYGMSGLEAMQSDVPEDLLIQARGLRTNLETALMR